jgi:hypothetical protein
VETARIRGSYKRPHMCFTGRNVNGVPRSKLRKFVTVEQPRESPQRFLAFALYRSVPKPPG